MKGKSTSLLIVATILVVLGLIISIGVMFGSNWDFKKISTVKYLDNLYEINEDYRNISITNDTADVIIVPSADGKTTVSCHERSGIRHEVRVEDGTLFITAKDERTLFEHISIGFDNMKITLSLPMESYGELVMKGSTGDLSLPEGLCFEKIDVSQSTGDVTCLSSAQDSISIEASTGDITLESLSAKTVSLTASTGKITLSGVNCEGELSLSLSTGDCSLTDLSAGSLTSTGSTGDVSLCRAIVKNKLTVTRSTGKISFDKSDAGEIKITASTGSVKGSLLTDKIFYVQSKTGKIDVPKSTSGGLCEITTNTGSIIITVG